MRKRRARKTKNVESILRRCREHALESYREWPYTVKNTFKAGDRVSMAWTNGFSTTGYILKRTERGLFVYFPSHVKARKIRFFSHDVLDDNNRLSLDVIGRIKQIMEEE